MGTRHLRSIRLLAECMQLFEQASARQVKQFGLTHPQFDILATLGNTAGMTCKELGEKTLITKGTLTGVLDRLEQKGIVERERGNCDRRQLFIKLSPYGQATFEKIFPQIVENGKRAFLDYTSADYLALETMLGTLKQNLTALQAAPLSCPKP